MSMQTAHAIMRRIGIKSIMITIAEEGAGEIPALMVEYGRMRRIAAYLTRKLSVEDRGTYALIR